MFLQKALLTQALSHPMQSWADLLFKASPKYELKIWLHAWLTASMDWEFPTFGNRIESSFTDKGGAVQCTQHKMNLGCQLNSLSSYSTCLPEYLKRKSLSKVNSTIRMFNSSKAVFKVNFEKVSQGTILF